MSLFQQTQYELDQLFYATFPAARDAARNAAFERSTYDFPSPVDCPALHQAIHPLEQDNFNERDTGSKSALYSGPTQELSYPQLHFPYPERFHPQQPFISHRHSQPSYYSPPPPVSFFLNFLFESYSCLLDRKQGSCM